MKNHSIIGPVALAVAAVIGFTGTATAQQFSDNFDSGSLDAWSGPFVQLVISDQIVSAATGSLRMQGTGSSTVTAENIFLGLAASSADNSLYQNGSVSFDLDLDLDSQGGVLARADTNTLSGIQFGLLNRTSLASLDRLFIRMVINDEFVASAFVDLNFEASSVRMDASWNGDQFTLTATDRLSLASMSVSLTDSSVTGGDEVGLAVARAFPNVFGFGGNFDNFSVVPAPGGLAVIGLGGLLAARRRRSVAA